MRQDELPAFTARMIELAELYDAALTESKVRLYFEALSDLDISVVCRAILSAVRTCKFMPRPAELRTLGVGDTEDQAEAAWMLFRKAASTVGAYSSLSITDAALGEAILAVFGSWPAACHLDLSPEMWAAKRKEFGRVYRVLSSRGITGRRHLTGIVEQQNELVPEWQRYVPLAVVQGHAIERLSGDAAVRELRAAAQPKPHTFERLNVLDGTIIPAPPYEANTAPADPRDVITRLGSLVKGMP